MATTIQILAHSVFMSIVPKYAIKLVVVLFDQRIFFLVFEGELWIKTQLPSSFEILGEHMINPDDTCLGDHQAQMS